MSKKPVPKKKQAVSSTRSRNSKYVYLKRKKLAKLSVMKCANCGATKRAHFACASCGKYNGRLVLNVNKEVQPVAEIVA
jgi:large subunit ribosomal protein L32